MRQPQDAAWWGRRTSIACTDAWYCKQLSAVPLPHHATHLNHLATAHQECSPPHITCCRPASPPCAAAAPRPRPRRTPLAVRAAAEQPPPPAPQQLQPAAPQQQQPEERKVVYNTEFGYSRKDIFLIGAGLIGLGYAMYYGLQATGMEPGIAGNWVQAIIFLGICVGWVSTYLYRVATKVCVRVHMGACRRVCGRVHGCMLAHAERCVGGCMRACGCMQALTTCGLWPPGPHGNVPGGGQRCAHIQASMHAMLQHMPS